MKKIFVSALLSAVIPSALAKYACTHVVGGNGYKPVASLSFETSGTVDGLSPGEGIVTSTYQGFTISGGICPNNFKVVQLLTATVTNYGIDYFAQSYAFNNAPLDRIFLLCGGLNDPYDKRSYAWASSLVQVHSHDLIRTQAEYKHTSKQGGSPDMGYGGYSAVRVYADSFVRYVEFAGTNIGDFTYPKIRNETNKVDFIPLAGSTYCVIVGAYSLDSKIIVEKSNTGDALPPIGGIGFIFDCSDDATISQDFQNKIYSDTVCNRIVDDINNGRKRKYGKSGDLPVDSDRSEGYFDSSENFHNNQ